MKRFDVQAWFGHWPFWDLRHKQPDDLLRMMDRHGIDRALCMSLRGLSDWPRGNDETLEVAAEHPDRLVPVGTIAPNLGGTVEHIRQMADAGIRGLRLYPIFHYYKLNHEFVDEICRAAGEHALFVSIPTRVMSSWRFATLEVEAVGAIVERHPATTFVMSGINYAAEFHALTRLMERCSNAFVEISCLQGFNAIAKLATAIGPERILFGTGAMLHYPACNVAKLDHAEIPDPHRNAIAWENAHRLLGPG